MHRFRRMWILSINISSLRVIELGLRLCNEIYHPRRTRQVNNDTSKKKAWCKQTSNFNVTMGSYDGVESCELTKLNHIPTQPPKKKPRNKHRIYRDDRLAICNKRPIQTEQIKKEICKVFKENKLKITIEANIKTVDFVPVTVYLKTGELKPNMKPNNTTIYVQKQSNHPPNIIKKHPRRHQ